MFLANFVIHVSLAFLLRCICGCESLACGYFGRMIPMLSLRLHRVRAPITEDPYGHHCPWIFNRLFLTELFVWSSDCARSAFERDSKWPKRWVMSGHFCNISLMRPTPLWFISNYIWLRLLSNCLVVAWPRLALLIMYAKIVSYSICPGNANQSASVGVHRILPHWMKENSASSPRSAGNLASNWCASVDLTIRLHAIHNKFAVGKINKAGTLSAALRTRTRLVARHIATPSISRSGNRMESLI